MSSGCPREPLQRGYEPDCKGRYFFVISTTRDFVFKKIDYFCADPAQVVELVDTLL